MTDVGHTVKLTLLIALGILSTFYLFWWWRSCRVQGSNAPTLVLFSLLGLDPRAAFPVMMGSAALAGPTAGIKYLNTRRYDQRAALGLTLGGIPAVLLAAFVVKSLPLNTIRWLVVIVIVYTAITMLRSARCERRSAAVLQGQTASE